jgi:hypothetical protein
MRYITGIAHVEVGRRHVDLGAQGARAIGKFAGLHALEQIEILFHGAVAVGAFLARLGERAAYLRTSSARQIAHVGFAFADQLHAPIRRAGRNNRRRKEAVFPVEAQPADVLHDGIDVLGLFFFGIGVVEAQVGLAAELRGQPKFRQMDLAWPMCR